jgi:hypothetical protein
MAPSKSEPNNHKGYRHQFNKEILRTAIVYNVNIRCLATSFLFLRELEYPCGNVLETRTVSGSLSDRERKEDGGGKGKLSAWMKRSGWLGGLFLLGETKFLFCVLYNGMTLGRCNFTNETHKIFIVK